MGRANYPFGQLLASALDGILNQSVCPVRTADIYPDSISIVTFLGTVGFAANGVTEQLFLPVLLFGP